MPSEENRREHLRFPSHRPVVMLMNDSNIFSTLTDFSHHGLGFMTAAKMERDETIEVRFDIPFQDDYFLFQFNATVRHCIEINDKRHVGVSLSIDNDYYPQLLDKIITV